ncbi:uncharacterized protein LOC8283812 [Ricinus communis]|uniref:uncharacterized protein LOC8283812 n=1 Tax=Ricinus communis TaxID=3988 RepID=UPI00201B1707|nr:uncharacterized protein LOC8283812 [Ricinus communis]
MWQLLLAAAVAGSTGFVAKHLLHHHDEHSKDNQEPPQDSIATPDVVNDANKQCGFGTSFDQSVFRFSSSASSSSASKKIRKNSAIKGRRLKFGTLNEKENQRSTASQGSARRFAVCLKKRRTAKCGPTVSSNKETTLFGWGLGVGIMYMMSAGKSEISKLSNAMDETSKVVQELRTELYKRKSARSEGISFKHNQQMVNGSGTEDRDPKDIKVDDIECPSSVLTEEPDPQVLNMDQLEAELASELQKLPWSDTETSGNEGGPSMVKNEVSSGGILEVKEQSPVSYQCHGILPSELDQKLCHLLIEQQENQIEELESELHTAQSKLNEKEAELQALKDCVRRLTEFSLSTVSDDEPEIQVAQDCISEWDNNNKIESQSEPRKSVVGMKRPIDSA